MNKGKILISIIIIVIVLVVVESYVRSNINIGKQDRLFLNGTNQKILHNGQYNPSIVDHNDNFLVLSRKENSWYMYTGINKYLPGNALTNKLKFQQNKFSVFDNNMKEVNSHILKEQGFEDERIFVHNKNIYSLSSINGRIYLNHYELSKNELNLSQSIVVDYDENFIKNIPNKTYNKNWVYIPSDTDDMIVHTDCYPYTIIASLKINKVKAIAYLAHKNEIKPQLQSNVISNTSNWVKWKKNKYITLVHSWTIPVKMRTKDYKTYIFEYNDDFKLVRHSREFSLENNLFYHRIQFASGLEKFKNEEIIITFGSGDSLSYYKIVQYTDIENLLSVYV